MSRPDTLPAASALNSYRAPGDFLDTYSISPGGRTDLLRADMRVLADHVLNADVNWMRMLLGMRDSFAGMVGMKTTRELGQDQGAHSIVDKTVGDRIGFFRIYEIAENEIILGEDDWHQDFRVSVLRASDKEPRIYASTCCKRHNLAGYAYLAAILPFHKLIVRTVLDKAVATGLAAVR